MSTNSLNDISKIYLEQVAYEALDPVGQEDDGVDNDGRKNTTSDKYLLKRRKAIGKAISTKEEKEVKRWWGDDGDGIGYEEGEVSDKSKKKKKSVKESFSNWRQDLSEVMDIIDKEKNDEKISEKKVKNKIKINPNIGEAVENLGGTLLEMVEIDEVDYIIESVYTELLDEGYDEDDIEEALEYALIEAKVTYGHDTPTGEKKRRNIVGAVGRLARQKLSSKVRGAKSAVKGAIASGARQVAKGALGVARKMEGDKKPSKTHSKPGVRSAAPYRGSGEGKKVEVVSSGSYTPPSRPKQKQQSQKSPDPWGEPTTPPKSESKPKPKPKAQQKTTTVTQKPSQQKPLTDKQKAAALRAQRRNINISDADLQRVISSVKEDYKLYEKAESEQQQKLFGLALSVKRGTTSRSEVSDAVLKIVDGMSEKEIRKFAKTKHEGIPQKVETKEEAIRQELLIRMVEKIEEQNELYIDEAKLSRTEKDKKVQANRKKNSKTMSLVDLDDNAMKEKKKGEGAKIEVKTGGKTKKSLTPQEFNHYKFKDDEKPDFGQFRSSKVFKKTLKGNKHVRNLHRGSDASGLTARGGMDNNREVVKHVRDSGFNKKHGVNFKGVHFTGDVPGKGTDDKKMKVIKNLIKSKKPKTIKFSDDHAKNLSAPEKFNKEEGKDKNKNRGSSSPKIKTYLTRDDGRPVRFGSGGRGVRDSGNVNSASSTKENQRRRQKARRGMGEAVEVQPKTQSQSTQQKPEQQQRKLQQQQDRMRQQEVQILQKKLQTLRSAPKGTDPSITT